MAKKTNILAKLEQLINQIISMLVLLVVLVRKIPPYGRIKKIMETANDYVNRVIKFMDATKQSEWTLIEAVSTDKEKFIDAVKFSIDLRKKPYEFNADYTKVRRIE